MIGRDPRDRRAQDEAAWSRLAEAEEAAERETAEETAPLMRGILVSQAAPDWTE